MWPDERALRGRGLAEEGLLARPERPRRCTLPMTALRVTPPSSAATWLALRPSVQSLRSISTRSSVHDMWCYSWFIFRQIHPGFLVKESRFSGMGITRSTDRYLYVSGFFRLRLRSTHL